VAEWQAEWKWDGIRAQLIRRHGVSLLWSRGDELISVAFPEIIMAADAIPDGTVLDGEVLAWQGDQPLPFGRLQRRLGRTTVNARLQSEVPVAFVAYDLLEWGGDDWRERPLQDRRRQLEEVLATAAPRVRELFVRKQNPAGDTPDLFAALAPRPDPPVPLRLSPRLPASSWDSLANIQRVSREYHVEGIMLKRLASRYGSGRQRGDWWKWKADPFVIDAVLIGAQPGHGRRANLFTDYTFGIWDGDRLVPVAKAYSGLTDEEIARVDAFVRNNITEKFGPLRMVVPQLVFELAFDSVQPSARHKAGLAVRFPRISRWRLDKQAKEADTIEALRHLMSRNQRPFA
jgi:DNA ligase-1